MPVGLGAGLACPQLPEGHGGVTGNTCPAPSCPGGKQGQAGFQT